MTEPGLLVQRIIYAGLDALRAVLPLDLCACVHVPQGFGPQLYLREPELSSLRATDAFALFGSLRDALDSDGGPAVDGYDTVCVSSVGERSRSLFVVGRRDGLLDADDRAVATALCDAIGPAAQALEEGSVPMPRAASRVSVDVGEGEAAATVVVPHNGQLRSGQATAHAPIIAVALATLTAVDPSLKLGYAGDDEVGGERAVLVVVHDAAGQAALGSALSGHDALKATASAALEAARQLSSGVS